MTWVADAVERLRRPEYTGANRCVPCTAVNVLIAAGVAVGVGLLPWRFAPAVGLLALAVGLVGIALRGYLVPGTPWLTATFFPDRVLAWFDKAPTTAGHEAEPLDVEGALIGLGALEECPDVDDLCLTPAFRAAWRDRIDRLREADTTRTDLAEILGTDPDGLTFRDFETAFVATDGYRRIGQWESHAAFLADVAAGTVLAERAAGWEDRPIRERGTLLAGLRLFLDRCPSCGGPVALGDEVKESCCRSVDVVTATCTECDARLLEAEQPGAA